MCSRVRYRYLLTFQPPTVGFNKPPIIDIIRKLHNKRFQLFDSECVVILKKPKKCSWNSYLREGNSPGAIKYYQLSVELTKLHHWFMIHITVMMQNDEIKKFFLKQFFYEMFLIKPQSHRFRCCCFPKI